MGFKKSMQVRFKTAGMAVLSSRMEYKKYAAATGFTGFAQKTGTDHSAPVFS